MNLRDERNRELFPLGDPGCDDDILQSGQSLGISDLMFEGQRDHHPFSFSEATDDENDVSDGFERRPNSPRRDTDLSSPSARSDSTNSSEPTNHLQSFTTNLTPPSSNNMDLGTLLQLADLATPPERKNQTRNPSSLISPSNSYAASQDLASPSAAKRSRAVSSGNNSPAEMRRQNHSNRETLRRHAIRDGFRELQELLGCRAEKVTILQCAISLLRSLPADAVSGSSPSMTLPTTPSTRRSGKSSSARRSHCDRLHPNDPRRRWMHAADQEMQQLRANQAFSAPSTPAPANRIVSHEEAVRRMFTNTI